jgi:hypothetical protein
LLHEYSTAAVIFLKDIRRERREKERKQSVCV